MPKVAASKEGVKLIFMVPFYSNGSNISVASVCFEHRCIPRTFFAKRKQLVSKVADNSCISLSHLLKQWMACSNIMKTHSV